MSASSVSRRSNWADAERVIVDFGGCLAHPRWPFSARGLLRPGSEQRVDPAYGQSPIQKPRIEASVPEDKNFHAFLKRDVLAYLKATEASVAEDVQIEGSTVRIVSGTNVLATIKQ
jgi:hypothetical protein